MINRKAYLESNEIYHCVLFFSTSIKLTTGLSIKFVSLNIQIFSVFTPIYSCTVYIHLYTNLCYEDDLIVND